MFAGRVLIYVLLLTLLGTELDAKKHVRGNRNNNRDRGRAGTKYIPPVSGQRIRLGGNESRPLLSGNVEVYVRNNWGSVCDDDWDIIDASVACRQMGFSRGAVQFTHNSQFGAGSGTNILMDDVGCHGNEQSLLGCSYVYPSNCAPSESAGVICGQNTGCPDGWIAGPESCYFLSNITTTQSEYAVNKCAKIGGHLAHIETEAENHFLSALYANVSKEPIIIGAVKKGSIWMWEKVERSSSVANYRRKRARREHGSRSKARHPGSRSRSRTSSSSSYERITQVSIDYFKWFPGWIPGNKSAEPSRKKKEKCLYLKSLFKHPDKSQGEVNVGYLYWDDDVCFHKNKRPWTGFRYLCERPHEEVSTGGRITTNSSEECYRENGASYRGVQSNTEKGTPCIQWADSSKHTPERFPDKGLEGHSYCRNPDDDVRPWCYVNKEGKFGFCPISQCVNESDAMTTHAPQVTSTDAAECPDDKFYCALSSTCIGKQWHCDYENDCLSGEDEIGCDYKILQFELVKNRRIADDLIKETFMGITNETCAKLCLSKESYVCLSFSFAPGDRRCELSMVNSQSSILAYRWKYGSNVYELVSQTESCDGRFTCNNGHCIEKYHLCDQQNDCGDGSDEQLDTDACRLNEHVEVRLVDGDEQSGRVEIKYLGEWGLVCDDQWDNNDAVVICNMLGYKGATAVATSHSKFGVGNGVFLLDEVKCLGIEDSISECDHDGWKVHNCRSFEVAGVECKAQKACGSYQYSCNNGHCIEASKVCDGTCHCNPDCSDENGDGESDCRSAALEIVDGPETGSGRVEVVRNGLRGTICDDSWDNNDATVVCKMVGYRFGEAVMGGTYGQGTGAIWLDDIECTGAETSLSACKMSNWGVSDCIHSEDAGVICSNIPPQTEIPQVETGTLEIVLVDGSSPEEGRVEVVYNGEQGTICDDDWDDNDATVICTMLGYKFGVAPIQGLYGPGSDSISILLDDVDCAGTETSLLECSHAGWHNSNCGHGEDAGVVCYMGEDDRGQVDTSGGDVLSGVTCGLRPLETNSRKKREEPGGPGERELAQPPKFERIIGGFTAAKGFYPWQVGVRRQLAEGIYSHWCGGTILSQNWILSAAHCFTDLHKGLIVVRTGDHDNKVPDDHEQEFELEQLISHQQYDQNTFDYDIALLKIKSKDGLGIKFGDHVQPACLPEQTTDYVDGQKCHVSGWGKTEAGYQNLLKSAKVPIIDDNTCQRIYKDITTRMVCAGYLAGGIDSCAGDSGGPLVCDINGRYTVMGATSWGAGCAEANAPGVYARVTQFIPWLKSTIKRYS